MLAITEWLLLRIPFYVGTKMMGCLQSLQQSRVCYGGSCQARGQSTMCDSPTVRNLVCSILGIYKGYGQNGILRELYVLF